jgi:GH24 family phage-related lysozyme (muramidase)
MCVHTVSLHKKKGTTLQNKHTSPNFETIRRLMKQKTQEKFSQEAIASSNKTRWQNIKTTWENNKNKPRKEAVANFQLNTGHGCLATHLYRIKIFQL